MAKHNRTADQRAADGLAAFEKVVIRRLGELDQLHDALQFGMPPAEKRERQAAYETAERGAVVAIRSAFDLVTRTRKETTVRAHPIHHGIECIRKWLDREKGLTATSADDRLPFHETLYRLVDDSIGAQARGFLELNDERALAFRALSAIQNNGDAAPIKSTRRNRKGRTGLDTMDIKVIGEVKAARGELRTGRIRALKGQTPAMRTRRLNRLCRLRYLRSTRRGYYEPGEKKISTADRRAANLRSR